MRLLVREDNYMIDEVVGFPNAGFIAFVRVMYTSLLLKTNMSQ